MSRIERPVDIGIDLKIGAGLMRFVLARCRRAQELTTPCVGSRGSELTTALFGKGMLWVPSKVACVTVAGSVAC